MKPPNIVTVHFLSAKWSKKLFTINHYELQNGKCIVTQELSAYRNYTMDCGLFGVRFLLLDIKMELLLHRLITHLFCNSPLNYRICSKHYRLSNSTIFKNAFKFLFSHFSKTSLQLPSTSIFPSYKNATLVAKCFIALS